METTDRSATAPSEARKSLRAFKASPGYRKLLERVTAQQETRDMNPLERRRLRLDRLTAELELQRLKAGEAPSEFTGLVALPDSLKHLGYIPGGA